jgi:hypothetical protein
MKELQTARQVLDVLDEFISRPGNEEFVQEKRDLWAVLTALRGPDKEYEAVQLKDSATAVVRAHAFPRCAALDAYYIGIGIGFDSFDRAHARITAENTGIHHHFARHIRDAFRALKLVWDGVNKHG